MVTTPTTNSTTTGDAAWSDALIAVLEGQRELVASLEELSARQRELIGRGRADDLLAVLTKRQQLIHRMHRRQDELSGLLGDLESRLDGTPADARTRIRGLVDDLGRRIGAVVARDEEDRVEIERARDDSREALGSLGSARQARAAYAGPRPATTKFADRKG